MTFYAIEPQLLRRFRDAVESAARSLEQWTPFRDELARYCRPPRVSFNRGNPFSILDPNDGGVDLKADQLPTAAEKNALFKVFAMRYPACQFRPNESKLFYKATVLEQEQPDLHLPDSREWNLLRSRLFHPEYLPDEFPFLGGNRDNSTASCLTTDEVREVLALEKEERLLDRGIVGLHTDSQSILGVFLLAAANRWYVWYHEVE